jgi:hypothetical protein
MRVDYHDVGSGPPTANKCLQQSGNSTCFPRAGGAHNCGVAYHEFRSIQAYRNLLSGGQATNPQMLKTFRRKYSGEFVCRGKMNCVIKRRVRADTTLKPTRSPVNLPE